MEANIQQGRGLFVVLTGHVDFTFDDILPRGAYRTFDCLKTIKKLIFTSKKENAFLD